MEAENTCEGKVEFMPNGSCVDRVYTTGKTMRGREDAGLFLSRRVQKAFGTVWRKGA